MSESFDDLKEYVDVDGALARIRGNKKLYIKMLNLFLQNEETTKINDYILAGDWGKAADSAHAIKGMTGNLSLEKLFKISTDLMVQLRQGSPDEETLADYQEIIAKTRTSVEHVISMLEE